MVNPELMNPNHDRKEKTTIFVLNSLENHGNIKKNTEDCEGLPLSRVVNKEKQYGKTN